MIIVAAMVMSGCDSNKVYVSPSGNDGGPGSESRPLRTIGEAIRRAMPGTTIVLGPGTYVVTEEECMSGADDGFYVKAFVLTTDGTEDKPITITSGSAEARPVIDLSEIKPAGRRVSGFWMDGDYWVLRGFDIVGIQVTIEGHTQAENITIDDASHCVIERVNMHDGMGIGVYAKSGHDNLVLNCDAYNNYDSVSENGKGGNSDGFGFHFNRGSGSSGNVIRGCRAWGNSDDGIDLINNYYAVTVDNCWTFWNGYDKEMNRRADGTGIKGGGYGLKVKEPFDVPRNIIRNCIAWANKNKGIYANHHLGGNTWENNMAMGNSHNFHMVNQKSFSENVDVPGYGHTLTGNISYKGRSGDVVMLDMERSLLSGNRFEVGTSLCDTDFVSLDGRELLRPRKSDGSLPDIDFMKLRNR